VHRSSRARFAHNEQRTSQYCRNERRVAFPRDWNAGGSILLNEKIAALKSQMAKLKEIEATGGNADFSDGSRRTLDDHARFGHQ
jgi:hypothetical protein